MAYTPTVWKNGEFPPIDAEHLNKIEQGIANSAPGGFGLGTRTVVSVSDGRDANDLSGCGFFCVDQNTPTSDWWYGYQIEYDVGYKYQRFGRTDNFEIVERKQINNVWGDWEYLNPPMNLGVEYRTTERYLGKPVYCKVVDFGTAPNNDTKNVSLSDMNIDKVCGAIFHYYVISSDENGVMTSNPNFTGFLVSNSVIQIRTNTDKTDTKFYVTIKYTKTTD